MKITLYKAFPDPYRQSMTVYVERLKDSLRHLLKAGDRIEDYLPQGVFLDPRSLRYISQYVIYPLWARSRQGDVNHITDHAYGHLLHQLDGARTVVTFHDAIGLKYRSGEYETGARREALRWVQQHNLSGIVKAARIICVSEASRKEFCRHAPDYPESKINVIYEGVSSHFFVIPPEDPRDYFRLGPGPYLLHVGHTQFYKNIPALFQILAIFKKWRQRVNLLKVGVPFTSAQEKLAEDLGVRDRVLHLGFVQTEKLPLVYRAADLLVMPSLDEGFGFPALEAMASQLPVVASNRGALPEIIGDAGVLMDPEDHEGMARAIAHLLEHAGRRMELIEAGIRRVRQFTWEKTAEETLRVYREVLKEAGRRPLLGGK